MPLKSVKFGPARRLMDSTMSLLFAVPCQRQNTPDVEQLDSLRAVRDGTVDHGLSDGRSWRRSRRREDGRQRFGDYLGKSLQRTTLLSVAQKQSATAECVLCTQKDMLITDTKC